MRGKMQKAGPRIDRRKPGEGMKVMGGEKKKMRKEAGRGRLSHRRRT
jgi:hypothetical protein